MKNKTQVPSSGLKENIELADELWLGIFSLIDPESLLSMLPLVSKKFYQLASDHLLWKKLFETLFSEDLPHPLQSSNFDWRTEFITLYRKHYGSLTAQARRCVFLITLGATQEICAAKFSIQDLEAGQFSLIKTAAQFKQQAILDHFYAEAQQQLEKHDYKGQLYWATLCNQSKIVASLLAEHPKLINKAIFEGNKTVTMLAALVGHLELMKELIAHPSNNLLQLKKGFKKLHQCIIRSGQLSTVKGFHSFIEEQEGINTSPFSVDSLEPSDLKKRSLAFSILNAAANLPSSITLAARYNSVTVFKTVTKQLQQKCIQLRECGAAEPSPNCNSASAEQDENELLQLIALSEAEQAYKIALSNFDWEIHQAMLEAAQFGHVDIIKYALENNFFTIDRPLLVEQQTLLYRAVLSKQTALVNILLNKQADPEVALTMLLSELSRLQSDGYSEMIALLREAVKEKNTLSNPNLVATVIDREATLRVTSPKTKEESAKRKFEQPEKPEKKESERKSSKLTENDSPNSAQRYRLFANSNQTKSEFILSPQSRSPNSATKETEIKDKNDSATYSSWG